MEVEILTLGQQRMLEDFQMRYRIDTLVVVVGFSQIYRLRDIEGDAQDRCFVHTCLRTGSKTEECSK